MWVSNRIRYPGSCLLYTSLICLESGNLVPMEQRNPMLTTTFGTGELIKDALNKGCRNFIIGIGGSATNDAGLGIDVYKRQEY